MIKRLEIQDDGVVKLFSFDDWTGRLSCNILNPAVVKYDNVFDGLKAEGLINDSDRFIYNKPIARSYSAPFKIYIDITDSCQLNCKHCLTKNLNCNHEIGLDRLKAIADEISELGVFYVKFGGGEPLLHPSFREAVRYYRSKGIYLSLSTNGYLVDTDMALFLRQNQVRTSVSIEGPAQLDQFIRGKGHFEVALNALDCLVQNGVNTLLRVTLTKYMLNFSYIQELLSIAKEHNTILKISYCRPAGSALDNKCMIGFEDADAYQKIVRYLNSDKIRNNVLLDEGMMFFQPTSLDWMLYKGRICGAANRSMHINSSGKISPCVFMGTDLLEMDSSYQFGDISMYWREEVGHTFRKVRKVPIPNECSKCVRKCKYECLATRLSASGCFSGKDPNCLFSI